MFVQTVSLEGSEWNRPVEDELQLIQTHSDFYHPDDVNELNLTQQATGQVNRAGIASNNLVLVQDIVFAGCLCGEGGDGGVILPVSAIFDANTQSGMAVYVSGDGHVDLAQADASATTLPIVGLAYENVLADGEGTYQTFGQLTLEDWTDVIGSQFLNPGSVYFLSDTDAGHLTTSEPEDVGDYVVIVGTALTQTTFNIEIHRAYQVGPLE